MNRLSGVHRGDAIADGKNHNQWFIGCFVNRSSARRTRAVEVKLSVHRKPFCEPGSTANRTSTSMALLISGKCTYKFRGSKRSKWRTITLSKPWQYVIWSPGVFHSLRVPTSSKMVVLRWPSKGSGDKIRGTNPWSPE